MADTTIKELEASAQKWVDAGMEYWELYQEAFKRGTATVWVKTDTGFCVFTRGEYHRHLIDAVKDNVGPTTEFGGSRDQ